MRTRAHRAAAGVVTGLAGLVLTAAIAAAGASAQYGPAPAPSPTRAAAGNTVVIKGTDSATYRFSPRTLRTKRRKRVKWTWDSNEPHNVVFEKLHKSSRTGDRGSYSLRFSKRGTYRYVCTTHGFTGKVVVR